MAQSTSRRPWIAKEVVKYTVSLVILGLGGAGMAVLWSLAKPPEDTTSDALVPMVKTFELQPYSGQLDLVVSGSVVPFREIKVAAEVGGRIKKKYEACEAGNFVAKGTPLLEIDDEDYELDLISIKADVTQAEKMLLETEEEIRGAKRNIETADNEYQLQRREFQRNERLKGVLSSSEVDAAERGLLASRSQLTNRKNSLDTLMARRVRMQASLDVTKARLNKAELNLRRTTIYAPDDGVIVREMVEKGDFVAPGTQLVMFEDTSRSEVLCNLTRSDLEWIRKNSKGTEDIHSPSTQRGRAVYKLPKTAVSIFETNEPEVTWLGVLERFDGIGRDELTKTIPCRIAIEEPVVDAPEGERALVRGMYVKCRMEVQTSAGSPEDSFMTFPEVAVRPGNFIWVVRDRKLYRVNISIADRTTATLDDQQEPFVIISPETSGLKIGDQIVISPLSQPTDGSTVILEGDQESESVKTTEVQETKASAEKDAKSTSTDS